VKIIAAKDYDDLSVVAADLVTQAAALQPTLNLVVPTGHTPIGLYRHLRARHANSRLSLNDASVFMLDEYVDLPSYPAGSFQSFLREHLGDVVFNGFTRFHPIVGGDERSSARRYDEVLDRAGGIDLAVVGVGRNGHVGFNEPLTPVDERTHVVTLTESTLDANFPGVAESERPTRAITLGLRDLIDARAVLMLVSGSSKAPILAALTAEALNPLIPATSFLGHPNFTIVADHAALSGA
jgi:glucosamine-6-phosphate deaminase